MWIICGQIEKRLKKEDKRTGDKLSPTEIASS